MKYFEYSIENHGDLLEQSYSSFILSKLPNYEVVWKNFVGHNGQGKMAAMVNISSEEEVKRQLFGQRLYTTR